MMLSGGPHNHARVSMAELGSRVTTSSMILMIRANWALMSRAHTAADSLQCLAGAPLGRFRHSRQFPLVLPATLLGRPGTTCAKQRAALMNRYQLVLRRRLI